MTFPYIIITSLAVLFNGRTPINAYGYNTNNLSSNAFTSDIARSYSATGNGYRGLQHITDNTFYFLCNPNDKTECLASLQVHEVDDFVNKTIDYTLTLNATSLTNCAWIGSINGDGIEEYVYTNYINYYIKYNDGLINFSSSLSMGSSYQTTTYTFHRTYTNDNSFYTSYIYFDVFLNNAHDVAMYTDGYNEGLSSNEGWRFDNFLFSIVDLPVLYLRSLFGFDLFGGISLYGIIITLITIAVVSWLIRKFI